jgi:hypothetical protein
MHYVEGRAGTSIPSIAIEAHTNVARGDCNGIEVGSALAGIGELSWAGCTARAILVQFLWSLV